MTGAAAESESEATHAACHDTRAGDSEQVPSEIVNSGCSTYSIRVPYQNPVYPDENVAAVKCKMKDDAH